MSKSTIWKVISLGMLVLVFVGVYFHLNRQAYLKQVLEQNQKLIEQLEAEKLELIRQNNAVIDSLKKEDAQQLENLIQQSAEIQTRIKHHEARPEIDLDFMAAADVIARSQYRPE